MYTNSIFIFRRDLRLDDNTALKIAASKSKRVLLCFILDPKQTEENDYKSQRAIDFMIEGIFDLQKQLKGKNNKRLYVFYGRPKDILKRIIPEIKAEAVFVNKDYTPFSASRDREIKEICKNENIAFESFDDYLLNPPELVLKNDNSPYVVFTPFYKKALSLDINTPVILDNYPFYSKGLSDNKNKLRSLYSGVGKVLSGKRNQATSILKKAGEFENYKQLKDFPSSEATTRLSPYIKFGLVSVRETYHHFKKSLGINHPLIRQLYWRDFWTYIAYHNPHVFGNSFYKKYDRIKWENNKSKFNSWGEARTGFPIVDAGMRELNETGFMHNRVRMITASFLVKDLQIDWRLGERYFAQKLVDYDPAVNNGNWQWAASTGCDAQPYFRIFNPWRQQEKFDFDCKYIKRWIPELNSYSNKEIHGIYKNPVVGYPRPIVEHKAQSMKTKSLYVRASRLEKKQIIN